MQKEMMQQLSELTQTLREVSDKLHDKNVQITVESLHVDRATLESLIFRLDSLDIHDLSGSLNLGNNFGQFPGNTTKSTSNVRLQGGKSQGPRVEKAMDSGDRETTAVKSRLPAQATNNQLHKDRLTPQTADGSNNLEETDRGFAIRF